MRKSLSPPRGRSLHHFSKILLLPILLFLWGNVWGQTTFNTPGTYSWTCPPNVTTIQVEAWGGGGAGGGVGTAALFRVAGGGGGGAYAKSSITVTPGNTYNITVGAGGAGLSAANGGSGGSSSFESSVIAAGGTGGIGNNTAASVSGGAGGSGSIGNITWAGGAGGSSNGTSTNAAASGGGGGGGGSTSNGGNANISVAGLGGTTGGGNGATGITANTSSAGSAGVNPGGGGAGAKGGSGNNSARLGGAGGAGRVTITYTGYCTPTSSSAYYITSVSTNGATANFTNSSVNSNGYSNFYDTKQATVSAGSNFTVSFAGVTGSSFGWAIWIDWNKNNVFDSGERVYVTSGFLNSGTSSAITVPASQAAGDYVMRILADYNLSNPSNSCSFTNASNGGEAEDYKLTVSALSSCVTPTSQPSSLTFGTTSASAINASFTGVASPNTPSGYLILRSTSATAPTLVNGISYTTNSDTTIGGIAYRVLQGSAIASLGTTIAETGLASNTGYYYYIYSYNSGCTGQPYYLTTSPLTGSKIACPAPATGATSNVTNAGVSVSWTTSAVGGSAETIKYRFELYSDSGRTTLVAGYPLADTVSPVSITSGLSVNTTYYYRIIAYNSSCQSTNLDGSFYNGVCQPSSSNTSNYISNFSTTKGYTSNITNLSSGYSAGGYKDNYATHKVEMYPTGSFDVTFSTTGANQSGTAIWVDWNNDWVFDSSERVYSSGTGYTTGTTYTVSIPSGTPVGDYRMRIRTMNSYDGDSISPCTIQAGRSEAEDYKITVVATPNYVVYTDATTANNTVNNTLNIYLKDFDGFNEFYTNDQLEIWMHAGIKTSTETWLYQNAGQDFNNTATLIKFTRESTNPNVYKATIKLGDWFCIPTGTTVEGLNLVFRNQYGGGGNDQTGDMVLDLTPAAVVINAPTSPISSLVTTTTATISWTAPTTGAVKGFDYYYSTSNTAPTSGATPGGTITGNVTTANLSSLSPATTYYYWVRTKGCDTNSAWTSVANFTTACAVVTAPTSLQTFDAYLPACWSEATGAVVANSVLSGTTSRWDTSANFGNGSGSNKGAKVNLYSTNNDWLISNQIDLGSTASQYRVSYKMAVTNYNGTTAQTTLGSHQVRIMISTDGGTTWSNTNVVKTYTGEGAYSNTGTTEHINLIGYSGIVKIAFVSSTTSSSPDVDFHIDDFVVETIPPTLLANNGNGLSLTFADQAITTTSAAQSFNLSGLMLTGAPGTITVSAPAGFEVSSVDNATWGTSTTVNYSSATLADKQINVRFKPTDCTPVSNATLTISGGGATVIPTVSLSGTGIIPAPTATAGTLITDTSFTANWDAVPGATGYELDVYKKVIRPNATDLFISEYVEGSSNNKYIEIFNGTGNNIDLSNYRLRLYANGNGGTADSDVILSGILANNSTKVYKNAGAVITLPSGVIADNNAAVNFNGDDAVALYKISSNSNVDIFGRIGNRPTNAWTGAGGYTTLDKTLRRISSIFGGISTSPTGTGTSAFTTLTTEWDLYNIDTVSDLGSHAFDGGTIYTYVFQNQNVGNATSHNIIGLDADTQYHYVVRAITATCESANSGEIDVKTSNNVVWDAGAWSNTSGPSATLNAIVRAPFVVGANATQASFTAKDLTVESTGSLEIPANQNITVTGNITTADNKIVVDIDGSLLQTNAPAINQNTGKIIAKRSTHMRKMDYTYWSTPVTGQKLLNTSGGANATLYNVGGFSEGTPNNRIYQYNEPNDTFKAATDANFIPAKAYAIRGKDKYLVEDPSNNPRPDTFNFTGVPNNGSYTVGIQKSKNTPSGNPAEPYTHGYNMIGNPYPSNIDFIKFYNYDHGDGNKNSDHILGKAWFWTNVPGAPTSQGGSAYTPNNYAILSLAGGTPATGVDTDETESPTSDIPNEFIKVAQGFIVEMKGTAPTGATPNTAILKFDNSIRTNNSTGHFYNSKNSQNGINRYWLKLTSPFNIVNTILVAHMDGATNNYDADYDADLLSIGDDSFYSKLNTQKLQIQARNNPLNLEDIIPLGTKYSKTGTYKISLGKSEGVFSSNQQIYLIDKINNTYTDLTAQDYTFTANKGIDDARFEIVYKNKEVLGTDALAKSDFVVYKDGNYFVVKSSKNLGRVELYDISGRLVQSNKTSDKEIRLDAALIPSGVYVIKAENSGITRTKKIIK